ncbi:phage tail tape measure protein [Caldanaerobacter subterraneus]|uniref:Phage tail tape measure protein n=1 Tax=Caldanaerobacter subterraneus TaxID=911092 RepID=A0A7Y2PJQ6_9THEO|nr:phage tail tape measure protein [Caldanaerobacter subterraneus]NNG66129.1 phage tail tape measure protein [Caldanaerobacter subterraneus]
MAEELGTLQVKIGMDSSGFQQGITTISRQMKVLQSDLKAQLAQFGENQKGLDALKVKYDSLTQQIELQKQKVDALAMAYQKSVEEKGADAKATQDLAIKLNNAKAELAKMENELKNVDEAIKKQSNNWLNFGKHMNEIAEKTKKMGESLGKVGKNLTEFVTLPIAGAVGGLLKLGSEFDKASDKIRVGTGATGKTLKELKDDFKAVYGSIPATMDEASTAISDLNTRLGLTGKPLQELSKQIILLSQLMKTDLNTTIEQVSHAFEAFNINAKDYGKSLDFVFKVSQSTGISIDNLLSTLQNSAPALKSMGLNFESAAALIGQLSKAGVNVEQVLTGLNKGIANMAKAGIKDANEAIAKLFEEIRKAPNDMMATQIAVENFGAKTGVAIAKAAREGKLNFEEFLDTLRKSQETINKAVEETDDFPEKLQTLKNKITVALEPLANSVFDAVNKMMPIIEQFANKLKNMIDKFANLSPQVQKNIVIFAGIAAALGPTLSIFSKFMEVGSGVAKTIGTIAKFVGDLGGLAGVVGKLAPAFNVLKTAISGVGIALKFALANPWVLAVAAIVAGVVLVITHWNQVKAAAHQLGESIKTHFENMKTSLENVWNSITTTATNVWQSITKGIITILSPFVNNILTIWNNVKSGVEMVFNGIKEYLNAVWDLIKNIILGAILIILDIVTGNFAQLKSDISHIWTNIKDDFAKIWDAIKQIFYGVLQVIIGYVQAQFELMKQYITNAMNTIKNFLLNAWNTIKQDVINVWNSIISWLSGLPSTLYNIAVNMFTSMRNGVSNTIGTVRSAIINGIESAISYIRELPSRMYSWGVDMIEGLVRGIENMIGRVRNAVSNIANTIRSYLHFSKPDVGPLREYEEWMPDFISGLSEGIEKSKYKLMNAIKGLTTDIAITINPAFNPAFAGAGAVTHNTTHNNNYSFYFNIEKVTGDKKGAETLINEFINGLKKKGISL